MNKSEDNKPPTSLIEVLQEQWRKNRLLRVVGMTTASCASFTLIHLLSDYLWKNGYIVDTNRIKSLGRVDLIYLSEKIPSSIHAALSALIAYHINVYDDKFFKTGNIWTAYPKEMDLLCSCCLGYSLYDMATMCLQGSEMSMWVHHLVAALGFICSMWYRRSGIVSRMLMTEATVIPANVLWYVNVFKGRKSRSFRRMQLVKMISFIVCRVGVGPWLIYRTFRDGQYETFKEMSIDAQLITAGIVIILSVLNINWTLKLIASTMALYSRKESVAM